MNVVLVQHVLQLDREYVSLKEKLRGGPRRAPVAHLVEWPARMRTESSAAAVGLDPVSLPFAARLFSPRPTVPSSKMAQMPKNKI